MPLISYENHFKSPSSKVWLSWAYFICILLLTQTHKNQTETSGSVDTKKKWSKSGGTKNESGDLLKEQFETTLCFFGAGGHVEISGILNFWPFGVEHGLLQLESSITSEISIFSSLDKSFELFEIQLEGKTFVIISCFLFFFMFVLLGCLVLVLLVVVFVVLEVLFVVVVLPEGAIFLRQQRGKKIWFWL